jgi:hypothetical protein
MFYAIIKIANVLVNLLLTIAFLIYLYLNGLLPVLWFLSSLYIETSNGYIFLAYYFELCFYFGFKLVLALNGDLISHFGKK